MVWNSDRHCFQLTRMSPSVTVSCACSFICIPGKSANTAFITDYSSTKPQIYPLQGEILAAKNVTARDSTVCLPENIAINNNYYSREALFHGHIAQCTEHPQAAAVFKKQNNLTRSFRSFPCFQSLFLSFVHFLVFSLFLSAEQGVPNLSSTRRLSQFFLV